ncbi:MAG: tyrosine--tRNA ligase, partial [Patescibacteria group bacterium]
MRKLQAFADSGHEAILIIGSFTAMIWDPSGRDTQRAPLTKREVEKNFETYKEQASKVLDFKKVQIRYNHEWLEKLTYGDILHHASLFTVQQMEERAMFAERMSKEKPVSVHEFLYPLMVGYDSVMLDVDCEIGGTDQEFNMLCGRTLQKAYGKREKFVLTTKLIEGTDGRKMSKTYENCVYLDDDPADMYGKLMSLSDDLIPLYMECCTDMPLREVKEVREGIEGKEVNPKIPKMRLAKEIVSMYHGSEASAKAEKEFEKVFKERGVPDEVPELKVPKGTLLIDALVKGGLASSKSEARRLIEQGGVRMNEKVVKDVNAKVEEGLTPEAWAKGVVVKVGKRKFVRVKIV